MLTGGRRSGINKLPCQRPGMERVPFSTSLHKSKNIKHFHCKKDICVISSASYFIQLSSHTVSFAETGNTQLGKNLQILNWLCYFHC